MRKRFLFWMPILLTAGNTLALDSQTPQNACAKLEAPYQAECNQLIPGSRFDPFAVGICDHMEGSADTLECMKTIEGGTYSSHDALDVCRLIPNPALAITCLDEAADEDFQHSAVIICMHAGNSQQNVECIKAVANKTYTDAEVVECDRKWPSGENMVRCLNERGKDHSIDYSSTDWIKAKPEVCDPNSRDTPMNNFIHKMESFQRALKPIETLTK